MPGPNNTAIGVFDVTEGPLVEITDVNFVGNQAFSARELSGLMETGKHNLLSRFFNSGTLDRKKLQDDVDRLTAFYYDHGYLQRPYRRRRYHAPRQLIIVTVNHRRRSGLQGRQASSWPAT